jgi:hypothetical protein
LKVVALVLFLANLLFLAFGAGYFGHPANPDAARLEQQLEPGRVRIVGYGNQPPPLPAERRSEVEEILCLRWEHLAGGEADQLASTLAEKFEGVRVERRAEPAEPSGWWVQVPPLATRAEAERKAAELKQLGAGDLFIMQDAGANYLAISLGVFSSERRAQERLAELKGKGVKSARVLPRPGKESLFALEARGPLERKAEVQAFATTLAPRAAALPCR